MAAEKATGVCSPMPSLRAISHWRSAHEQKAPMAKIVISCQRPPSFKGAHPRPYDRSGGAIEILRGAQVGPIAAP